MAGPDLPGQDPSGDTRLRLARQRQRAAILALLLGGLVILVFAITIVKIRQGMGT